MNRLWGVSRRKPRFDAPQVPEPKKDGAKFMEGRRARQEQAREYERARALDAERREAALFRALTGLSIY